MKRLTPSLNNKFKKIELNAIENEGCIYARLSQCDASIAGNKVSGGAVLDDGATNMFIS